MPYDILPENRYRSPIYFGPMAGPRQGPDGKPFDLTDQPRIVTAAVSYLTERSVLERILPENMELNGEPVVTVDFQEFSEIAWLAGRSYRIVRVKFPVRFNGKKDKVTGQFLAVIWENLTDPIISGREELGYSKIYADIAPERVLNGVRTFSAGWEGHPFFEMVLDNLREVPPEQYPDPAGDGILNVKYVPGTGEGAPPDAHYVTLTPKGNTKLRYTRVLRGTGTAVFRQSTWEQLPTLYRIVNTLAEFPVLEARGAAYLESRGGRDLSDQRRLD